MDTVVRDADVEKSIQQIEDDASLGHANGPSQRRGWYCTVNTIPLR